MVLHVIPHARAGGMQQVATDLNSELPAYGIDSELIDLASWTDGDGPRIVRQIRGWLRLIRRLRDQRPDAVLAHTVLNGLYSLTAARLAGVNDRWLVIHGSYTAMGWLRVMMIKLLCATAMTTGIICCGHTVKESYMRLGRAVRRRLHVVQNGARLPVHDASRPPADFSAEPGLALVIACRLVHEKGVDTAIRACAQASSRVHLTICGDGPQREELEALAQEIDAPVEFAGNIDRTALAERFSAAEAFLLPSEYEGLPLVLIEAAAAGLAVVASDIPANREVMGPAAIYCPVGDIEEFTQAIDLLATDVQHRCRLQSDGRERVDQFTVDRMVADYAALLRRG
ncbi:glycosyltransferase family 4 protein [Propionibacterium sp. oral taxon 192]|uniref:glycosyltransferase family 4 protein n=1 Tax=Propionibacterium sp. oral taxon 192 TaxID=671222 RepID=UPI0009FC582F|nr:glycosyltransferase family 4 protein [Propionibacterium sp. oral taxon 192]